MLLQLSFLLAFILFFIFYFFLRAVKLPTLTYYFFIFYLPFILSIIGFFFFFEISTYRTLPERVNVSSMILITFVLIVFFSLIGVFVLFLKIFYKKNIIKDYNHLLRYKKPNSSILIFIFGSFYLIIQYFAFENSLGITGVQQYSLPYKLTGILFYFSKYLSPIIMALLYFKSKKSYTIVVFVLFVAVFVGLTSASRGVMLLISAPIVFDFLSNKKYKSLILSCLIILIGFIFITEARNFIYDKNEIGTVIKSSEVTVPELAFQVSQILFYESNYSALFRIGRVFEPIENLFLASGYNSYNIPGGPEGVFSRTIYRGISPIDNDAHHMEWVGMVPSEGFVFGGRMLSTAIILFNDNIILFIFLTAYISFILVFIESLCRNLEEKYNINSFVMRFLKFGLVSVFFIEFGSKIFIFILFSLSFLNFMPRLRLGVSRRVK